MPRCLCSVRVALGCAVVVLLVSSCGRSGSVQPPIPQLTALVKDIQPEATLRHSSPHDFVSAGIQTYFVATTSQFGTELWKTDGTAKGTVPVADIVPGSISSLLFRTMYLG